MLAVRKVKSSERRSAAERTDWIWPRVHRDSVTIVRACVRVIKLLGPGSNMLMQVRTKSVWIYRNGMRFFMTMWALCNWQPFAFLSLSVV